MQRALDPCLDGNDHFVPLINKDGLEFAGRLPRRRAPEHPRRPEEAALPGLRRQEVRLQHIVGQYTIKYTEL